MRSPGPFNKNQRNLFRYISNLLFVCLCYNITNAQICPPNIDFENGTFDGWQCYIGSVAEVSGQNVISITPSGPVLDRHTMYTSNSNQLDPYGGFPVNCPNGSGHSIRLGNDQA